MTFTLDDRVRSTYLSLRVGVAILGIIFPALLYVGGRSAGIPLEPSMSAYYYATSEAPNEPKPPCPASGAPTDAAAGTMRNWFVGILFAVGAMLYVNKGFSDKENLALNIAGVMAVGIALFPMSWTCEPTGWFSLHGSFAIAFFACIVFVCEFCSNQTLQWLDDMRLRDKFRMAYHGLAALMLLSPLCAAAVNFATKGQGHFIFFAEAFGIWSFATFWLVKSYEIRLISRQPEHGPVAAAPQLAAATSVKPSSV
jgi:hypothetical protein